MIELSVVARSTDQSADSLRKSGSVPAIFYGPKEESTPITVDSRLLEKVWKDAGETTIVKLVGLGEAKDTLIHDVQVHPVTGAMLHADFYVIEKGKKVSINVPLEFVGESLAEKAGHIVVKALHEIEIEVAPAELPHHLEVDISSLEKVGDHVLASQVKLPSSAELITDGEEIIVSITEFVEEKAEITPVDVNAIPASEVAAPGDTKKEE